MRITLELESDHPPKLTADYYSRGGRYFMSVPTADMISFHTESPMFETSSTWRDKHNTKLAALTWKAYAQEKLESVNQRYPKRKRKQEEATVPAILAQPVAHWSEKVHKDITTLLSRKP